MAEQSKTQKQIASRKAIRDQLLKAVDVEIEPVPVSFVYRCNLVLVCCAMLLLPLAYFLLLFLIGHTVYWHFNYWQKLTEAGIVLKKNDPNSTIIVATLIIAPIILLFLIKPLFYRDPREEGKPQRLKESAEPFLFEYVATICKAVGAPAPKSIRVNCEVNASAGFRRGVYSMFSNDLTLTIGLPLVAGMTVRELTGVLAHEFGHFSQKAGMRGSFITSYINYWFYRAVYKRDALDEQLANACGIRDLRIMVLAYTVQLGVWLSRKVLYLLALSGNVISCLMLRRMEFDADRYEAHFVGSKAFAKTSRRISQLGFANFMALQDLQRFFEEKRLADNLPRLVVSNIPHITPEIRKALREAQESAKTGLLDTHPSDPERIKSAEEERTEGSFQLPPELENCPATILFDDFDRICRHSTLEFYHARLGKEFEKDQVTSTEDLVVDRNADFEAHKALNRYFQVRLPIMQPVTLPEAALERPTSSKETFQQMKEARTALLESVDEYRSLCCRMEKADSLMLRTGEAIACLDCNLRIRRAMFELPSARRKDIEELHGRSKDSVRHLATRLVEFETNATNRLTCALQLLNIPAVAERIPNAESLRQEIRRLIPEALFVSGLIGEFGPLRILYRRLHALCSHIDKNSQNNQLIEKITDQMHKLHRRLTVIHDKMQDHVYPFNSGAANLTLVQYALPQIPEKDELFGIVYVTGEFFEKLAGLQVRLFARLGQAGEQVETAFGLPLLPEPDLSGKSVSKSSEKEDSPAKAKPATPEKPARPFGPTA